MNSWPAQFYYFLNGWILRFTEGVTSRANSVFPLHYTSRKDTIDKDINFVEKAYKTYKLPAIFTIPNFYEPKNLVIKLLEHEFKQVGCITFTMVISTKELQKETINEDFAYNFHSKRVKKVSDFLARYSSRDSNAQIVLNALYNRILIPKKQHLTVEWNNTVVGTVTGILDPQGYLYIADMLVHPDFRQQNIASSMFYKLINDWGLLNGAKKIYLQVESENTKAVKLYSKLGLIKAYSYYYLEKSL
ncbi:MAG: GNAT family N-acetyltransferase [Promethearchaeota archaeon]